MPQSRRPPRIIYTIDVGTSPPHPSLVRHPYSFGIKFTCSRLIPRRLTLFVMSSHKGDMTSSLAGICSVSRGYKVTIFSANPDGPKRAGRRKLNTQERSKVHAVRKTGACLSCRMLKVPVSESMLGICQPKLRTDALTSATYRTLTTQVHVKDAWQLPHDHIKRGFSLFGNASGPRSGTSTFSSTVG